MSLTSKMSELDFLPEELRTKSASKLLGRALIKLMKEDILERYKETRELTDEDWEFCESIDWHPVDELSPKPEHIKELKKALKEPNNKSHISYYKYFY